jgi:hypothetical protein
MNIANPFERIPDNPYELSGTDLDGLLKLSFGGIESARAAALAHWNGLSPESRKDLQVTSAAMAGGDISWSSRHAQDLLLLDRVGTQAA